MEMEGKSIERLNDEGWITYIAYPVQVAGHLNNLNEVLQGKGKCLQNQISNVGN
jgi:hypothetical protein